MFDADTCRRFEKLLQNRLREIHRTLSGASQRTPPVELETMGTGRMTLEEGFRQRAMANGLRELLDSDRRKVEAALDRIAAGSYGRCCACNIGISLDRLHSDPATPFCAECYEDVRLRRA